MVNLGLKTNLGECGVPPEDVYTIAEQACGGTDEVVYPKVVALLQGLYPFGKGIVKDVLSKLHG